MISFCTFHLCYFIQYLSYSFCFPGKSDSAIQDDIEAAISNKIFLANSKLIQRPSLTKTVLSSANDQARQQALQNVLQALQIHLARFEKNIFPFSYISNVCY